MARVNALFLSLVKHSFQVANCSTARRSHYYCEFSGGRDLYITKPSAASLVFLGDAPDQVTHRQKTSPDQVKLLALLHHQGPPHLLVETPS